MVLETNFGDIVIELYPQDAPITVDNFLSYVNSDFYSYLLFHRSESKGRLGGDGLTIGSLDVIQGGGFYLENIDGNTYIQKRDPIFDPIANESNNGLSNLRGTISMARTAEPDSATSQFFINHKDNAMLDYGISADGYGYCVFGQIIKGMDAVDAIAQTNIIQTSLSVFFPYNPAAGIYQAYVLPCESSYCSDFVSAGQINFEDFALFASNWLNDACGSANDFCNGTDLDYSGDVDMADLALFLDHWAQTAGYEPFASDLVSDNSIILDDFTAFGDQWLNSNCDEANQFCSGADINRDGRVDFIDFAQMTRNWLIDY